MEHISCRALSSLRTVRRCGLAVVVLGVVAISRASVLPRLGCAVMNRIRQRPTRARTIPAEPKQPPSTEGELSSESNQKLEQTVQALEGFCYTIAHDFRAPLRAMEGFAQALLDDYGPSLDETGRDYARRISAAACRLDRMLQDLLEFEQLATLEPPPSAVDLNPVVQEALSALSAEIHASRAVVTVETPLLTVRGNRTLLEKALRELLSNALQFVPAGNQPSVRIWTEQASGFVTLLLQDNGIGISPKHQQQIFEPFVRLCGEDASKGTGIGLAIVKRSAERMGGTVTVESQGESGTCFRLVLPAV